MYARGIDVSTFQDDSRTPAVIDWARPKEHDIAFVVHRAVMGAAKDDDFALNWPQMRKNGYIRGAYGFWDYRAGAPTPEAQAKAFALVMKPDPGEMPVLWGDFERPNVKWPALPPRAVMLDQVKRYIFTLEDASGMAAGFYLNGATILYLMSEGGRRVDLPDSMRERELFVAAWPTPEEGMALEAYIAKTNWQPSLFGQWRAWRLWQYGTPAYGKAYGMESGDVDADFFNGDQNALKLWCGTKEQGMSYKDNAIGLFTETASWANPNYDFIVGLAGKSWFKPNENLAAIDNKAAGEKKPFLAWYKWSIDFYIRMQVPHDVDLWPPVEQDEPLQMLIRAIRNRNIRGVVVDITDNTTHDGVEQEPGWVSFASKIFVGRVGDWLRANKPDVKLFVASSNDFISNKAPNMNNWVHAYPTVVVEELPASALSASYPPDTKKPAYLGASDGWKFWRYYTSLVLSGTPRQQMLNYLGYTGAAEPPADTTPPSVPDGLAAEVSGGVISLKWQASSDNAAVFGYNVYENGVKVATVSSVLPLARFERPAGTYVYQVEALDSAGNCSARSASVSAVVLEETDGIQEVLSMLAQIQKDLKAVGAAVDAIQRKQDSIFK